MIKKFLAASLILFLFAPINAKALELLAIVVDWCPYCQRFESSLVPEYTGDVPLVVVNKSTVPVPALFTCCITPSGHAPSI